MKFRRPITKRYFLINNDQCLGVYENNTDDGDYYDRNGLATARRWVPIPRLSGIFKEISFREAREHCPSLMP